MSKEITPLAVSPPQSGEGRAQGLSLSKGQNGMGEKRIRLAVKTAVLVDGSYFLKRFHKIYPEHKGSSAAVVAKKMHEIMCLHARGEDLYRILFYDCSPFTEKAHHPLTKKCIDFAKTPTAVFRRAFHREIIKLRKVALRLGELSNEKGWEIREEIMKGLVEGKKKIEELVEDDFFYEVKQKGVDIRIGLDIAALAYKRLVGRIILVAGDCDFVPAAKLARKEGIDFILDPMWHNIRPSLHEHIDGLKSTCPRPR